LPPDHVASIPQLGSFLDWIDKNLPNKRLIFRDVANNLLTDSDPELLANNPSLGKSLATLYWNGNRRIVKKIIRKMLSLEDPIRLAANPDLAEIIHIANLSHSHTHLVRFGAKLISNEGDRTLLLNPSLKEVLGEFDAAKVWGIREFVESLLKPLTREIPIAGSKTEGEAIIKKAFNGPGFLSNRDPKCVKLSADTPMSGTDAELSRTGILRSFRPQFGPQNLN